MLHFSILLYQFFQVDHKFLDMVEVSMVASDYLQHLKHTLNFLISIRQMYLQKLTKTIHCCDEDFHRCSKMKELSTNKKKTFYLKLKKKIIKKLTVIWNMPHAKYKSRCVPSFSKFSIQIPKGSTNSVAK